MGILRSKERWGKLKQIIHIGDINYCKITCFSKYTGSKYWHNNLPQKHHFFTFPPESFKLYLPGRQQIKIQTWTVESAILMNTLFCTARQTDRITLPSAIDRIQITNYSWTHERKWMKLCLKHQLGYNKRTLLPLKPSKFMKTCQPICPSFW